MQIKVSALVVMTDHIFTGFGCIAAHVEREKEEYCIKFMNHG